MKTKLYQLVRVRVSDDGVEQGRRSFIGQVLSLPTPDQTIMIRTIPGHPGTLQELPLSALEPLSGRYRYVAYAKVRGHGAFPSDMLRYDSCVPLNFRLEPRERFTGGYDTVIDPKFGFDDLIVAKVTLFRHGQAFTKARWASFMWQLNELKVEGIGNE